jgi:phenylalanyl-tRNA synthetase beta chain
VKILHSWLREFIDTSRSPEEIADLLTMAGIEVASCRFLGDGLEKVVTARILSTRPHPNADRLTLCAVTDGTRELPIVCGAKNMGEGDVVALALEGAKLPNGIEIRRSKIRGELSEGMLCSETELHLAEESSGILVLPPDTAVGLPLAEALGLYDWLLEVEITPNRGDCLSVLGVARELACLTGEKVVLPPTPFDEAGPPVGSLASVSVEDGDLCPRYAARVIEGIDVASSPAWMRRRLTLCGIRPINNVVDITNYLLLEAGQPMHAFDLDRLAGARIAVRRSGNDRSFVTLDGQERKVPAESLLIWDGERPVAVAGVMGGENTEVLPTTSRVLFESAHFAPGSVRRTARRLGISSESSYRFERGVDPEGAAWALDRAVSLLARESAFTVAAGTIDTARSVSFRKEVPFRPSRPTRIIGREYTAEACARVFERLAFPVDRSDEGRWVVTVSSHRFDLEREIDLVEEIARIVGYGEVPTTYPESAAPDFSDADRLHDLRERLCLSLNTLGFSQAINLGFVSEREWAKRGDLLSFDGSDAIRLANPISEETTMMRPALFPGLLGNLSLNLRHFAEEARLFEIGKVFGRSHAASLHERERIALVLYGKRVPLGWNSREEADFHDLKGVVETLFRSAASASLVHVVPTADLPWLAPGKGGKVLVDGAEAGWIGAVNRRLTDSWDIPGTAWCAEIDLASIAASPAGAAKYAPIPKYPPVARDYACLLPAAVPVGDVEAMLLQLAPEVADARVFDVYSGDRIEAGKKSVAFRVRLQSPERTLTDVEVERIHTNILKLLENRFGGRLRA